MKPLLLAVILALPAFCLSQYTYQHLQVNFLETPTAANAYTYKHLRLYPVYAKESFRNQLNGIGKYTSLPDAVRTNKVRIHEQSEEGAVDALIIENLSQDTIIVLPGDIIKGGKQDRVIRKDLVLAPRSGKHTLPVFCVESGRWSADTSPRSSEFRESKQAATFNSYHSKATVSLRKVVEKEKNQQKVWQQVEEINIMNETLTPTKTYTAITTSADFSKQLRAYIAFFGDRLQGDSRTIGVAVVSGNTVLGCDLFATHDLFASQLESLLQSYATEAILNGKPVQIGGQAVRSYLDALLKSEPLQTATLQAKGSSFMHHGKKLRVSSFD